MRGKFPSRPGKTWDQQLYSSLALPTTRTFDQTASVTFTNTAPKSPFPVVQINNFYSIPQLRYSTISTLHALALPIAFAKQDTEDETVRSMDDPNTGDWVTEQSTCAQVKINTINLEARRLKKY
jgi:hypothetical protein